MTPQTHSTPLFETERGMKKGSEEVDFCVKVSDKTHNEKTRLTHFIEAGEASGHGCMFGGLAQIWRTGRPHFASLTQ